MQRTIFDDVHDDFRESVRRFLAGEAVPHTDEIAPMWRGARVTGIHGGTTEIMKEIIGRPLGLG